MLQLTNLAEAPMPAQSRPKVLASMTQPAHNSLLQPICKEAEAVSLTEYCRGRGYLPRPQSLSERGSYSSLYRGVNRDLSQNNFPKIHVSSGWG